MNAPIRVLVVDDDPDIRTVAQLSLGLDPGIAVECAGSRAEALAMLGEGQAFDALLLDVMMPDMDGPTLAGEIRRLPGRADTPILFMTARARPADLQRYAELGAAGVIVKPFDPLRLAAEVRRVLATVG